MKYKICLLIVCLVAVQPICFAQEKLKVVLAGLSHDHVDGTLDKYKNGHVEIISIAESNQELCEKKKTKYLLPDSIFFKDLNTALQKKHPDLVMVYNSPSEHLAVAEKCMPLHIPVMFEKPLAFSYSDALKIKALSEKYKTKVYTNYPSVWYTSFIELLKKSHENGAIGKMVMRGGHRGPVEVGCSKEFLNWLTDSEKNGGGALIDFGCYGAAVMTELMDGKAPLSVYATAKHLKPKMYPKSDDAATIIAEYPGATGITEASWDWPYTIMDVEVFGKKGYLHASQFNTPQLQSKKEGETKNVEISTPEYKDEVEYLTAVLKNGAQDNNKLLSLERNLVVVRILDAARKSVKEGRRIGIQVHND
jgi:predicted dehydrogenase